MTMAFVIAWMISGIVMFTAAVIEELEWPGSALRPVDWPFLALICMAFGLSLPILVWIRMKKPRRHA